MSRSLLVLPLLMLFAASCKKDHIPSLTKTDSSITTTPASSPVNTSLIVYNTDNTYLAPVGIQAGGSNLTFLSGNWNSHFYSQPLTIDEYQAVLTGGFADYWNSHGIISNKVFTALNAQKNYVDMRFLPVGEIFSFFSPFSGQTFSLAGNAQINFPADAFGKRMGEIDTWYGFSAPSQAVWHRRKSSAA